MHIQEYKMRVSDYIKRVEKKELKELGKKYIEKIGDEEVILIRVPARINLLGTHVEHRSKKNFLFV